MKKSEVFDLLSFLENTDFNNIQNSVFQYAVQRNIDRFGREAKTLQKTIESMKPNGFKELHTEVLPIMMAAMKDAKPEQQAEIEAKVLSDWEKGEDWKKQSDAYRKEVNELLESDSDINLYKIKFSTIEGLGLNQNQMKAVMPLIEE
ncbi:MAG TPA: hypothetical protein DCR40_17985 [Prolixibacteraceae bacterium]|nr:hypothetical protein [Prolixibacteraceae bacterium]